MGEEYPSNRNQFVDAVTCHKMCMDNPNCHSFLAIYEGTDTPFCDLFDQNLGVNGTRAEPTPVSVEGLGWYDRNCPQYLPTECGPQATTANPAQAMITAAPKPRDADNIARIERRYTSIPNYLSANYAWAAGYFLSYGCSCIITSALPAITTTSTSSVPYWLGTVTTTSTFDDWFTVTVTPASTTVFPSIM